MGDECGLEQSGAGGGLGRKKIPGGAELPVGYFM